MSKKILITGGDGYIGFRLAMQYLEHTDETLLLWVRADNETEARLKKEKLESRLGKFSKRVCFKWGDLVQDLPFHAINPSEVKGILHAAAVTRFNVDEVTAQRVNVEGTLKILQFADQCQDLERFGLLSTVYSSGLKSGLISEVPLDGKEGFANYYEKSKWQSETLLQEKFNHLPWKIFRIATIISENDSGSVMQHNALHNTLKLFYYGLLSLIPGNPETPLYFVTNEFATKAIFSLMTKAPIHSIFHVAHKKEESLTLDELITHAFESFEEDQGFKVRRVLKPLYSDLTAFKLLSDGVQSFSGGVLRQAVSSISPFAEELFVSKEIDNQKLVSRFQDYAAPDPREIIRNTCHYLMSTKWSKSSNAVG